MNYFIENNQKKVPLGICFVETPYKRYSCEFIRNKEELWIYFIENA